MDAFLGNLTVGLLAGAWIGVSGYIGSKEKFDFKKLAATLGISALGGVVASLLNFDPWTLDKGTLNAAVAGEGGVLGSATYAIQKIINHYRK